MEKKYNYKKIRSEVLKIAREACYSPKNKFTETVWDYHIVPVVEHGLRLGKKLKADLEIIELAALLHDHASLVDEKLYEKHHIHGAEFADKFLTELNYSKDKIKHIKECILSHRGSVSRKKESLEARILASADAMSHITELADMFYLTFGVHKYKTPEGVKWLKGKIERSWKKIMPEGKNVIKSEYDMAMFILNKAVKINKVF